MAYEPTDLIALLQTPEWADLSRDEAWKKMLNDTVAVTKSMRMTADLILQKLTLSQAVTLLDYIRIKSQSTDPTDNPGIHTIVWDLLHGEGLELNSTVGMAYVDALPTSALSAALKTQTKNVVNHTENLATAYRMDFDRFRGVFKEARTEQAVK